MSYAWGPERSKDPDRAGLVTKFCERMADAPGLELHIIRDTTDNRKGGGLAAFERRIGMAERVFVFLSEAYLRSPHCMHELLLIWEQCQREDIRFRDRVRPFTMPGTKIF